MNALASAVGSWMRHASCAATPDLSWTQERWRVSRTDVEQMAAVCEACPVAEQCREFVAATRPTAGFWAGAFRERWQVDTTVPMFLADFVADTADVPELGNGVDVLDVADEQVPSEAMQPAVDSTATEAIESDVLDAVRRARRRDLAVARRRERAERHRQARREAQQRLREELEAMPVAGLRRVGGGRR